MHNIWVSMAQSQLSSQTLLPFLSMDSKVNGGAENQIENKGDISMSIKI